MTTLSETPHYVARIVRDILKAQCSMAYMDQATVRKIFDAGLLVKREWPGWHIVLTDKGRAYLAEARL